VEDPRHARPPGPSMRLAVVAFAASCAVYLLLCLHQLPFHPGRQLGFFDLKVYRGGGRLVLDGMPLYGVRVNHSFFTYPPLSALLFIPLALTPLAVAEFLVLGSGIALLVALLWCAVRLQPARSWLEPSDEPGPRRRTPALASDEPGRKRRTLALALLAASVGLWLEPVLSTLAYGQIDLLIATLVVLDLSRADDTRTKGALIGIAAGLKLTPIIFAAYLLLSGRSRAAGRALVTFAAMVALGFALLPGDSASYWGGTLFNSSHVGDVANPLNQSLRGTLTRVLHTYHVTGWWLAAAVLVTIAGLGLAALASRRGDEATGFSLCAITALLVSPISWTHHWVLALPAVLLLALRVHQRASRAGAVRNSRGATEARHSGIGIAAAAVVLAVGLSYAPWWISRRGTHELHLAGGDLLAADPYVLIGLAALAVALTLALRDRRITSVIGAGPRQSSSPAAQPRGSHRPPPHRPPLARQPPAAPLPAARRDPYEPARRASRSP
jgi:alpha-1,2-mannosyltransferase